MYINSIRAVVKRAYIVTQPKVDIKKGNNFVELRYASLYGIVC